MEFGEFFPEPDKETQAASDHNWRPLIRKGGRAVIELRRRIDYLNGLSRQAEARGDHAAASVYRVEADDLWLEVEAALS